jgi:hypothetical protein
VFGDPAPFLLAIRLLLVHSLLRVLFDVHHAVPLAFSMS